MKLRWIAFCCAVLMLLSLAACADSDDAENAADSSATEENAVPNEEIVFDQAFEADKTYDIDAMVQSEYTINFSKTLNKEKLIADAETAKEELDQDELAKYIEGMKEVHYQITGKAVMTDEELSKRIGELSEKYNDTDQITGITVLFYTVDSSDHSESADEMTVEMICVGGRWYCYMGDNMWRQ